MRKGLFVSVLGLALVLFMIGDALAITDGQKDVNGGYPYVGLVVSYVQVGSDIMPNTFCSGSLLTPTLVLTAAHCTYGAVMARVWFESEVTDPENPNGGYGGTPYSHPDWCWGCSNGTSRFDYRDVGVVVLREPVPSGVVGDYAALPTPGQVDTLEKNAPIDIVGYGAQEATPSKYSHLYTRYYAFSRLISGEFVSSDEFIKLTSNQGGMCFGDSGGPDLLSGTNVVLAINTAVASMTCSGVAYSSRVDIPEVLDWINSPHTDH